MFPCLQFGQRLEGVEVGCVVGDDDNLGDDAPRGGQEAPHQLAQQMALVLGADHDGHAGAGRNLDGRSASSQGRLTQGLDLIGGHSCLDEGAPDVAPAPPNLRRRPVGQPLQEARPRVAQAQVGNLPQGFATKRDP